MIINKKKSHKILDLLLNELQNLNLYPVIGVEVEFYIVNLDNSMITASLQADQLKLDFEIEKEKGHNQFEFKVEYTADIKNLIKRLSKYKLLIQKECSKQGAAPSYSSKPFNDYPGSATHFHVNLIDANGKNLFVKTDMEESNYMLYSIAGLCETMHEMMVFFSPEEDDYSRYKTDHIHSPSKVCWGGNNRSAAIRIPLDDKLNRRLEHRVSSAGCNPLEAINAILFGILYGIRNKLVPTEKVYGNAFMDQYDYPRILSNLEQAKQAYLNGHFIKFMEDVT